MQQRPQVCPSQWALAREDSHLQTPWGLTCPLTRGTLSLVSHHHKVLVHPGSSCAADQSQSILCPGSSPVPAQEGTGQKCPCLCCRADNLSRATGGSHSAQHPLPAPGSGALLQAGGSSGGMKGGEDRLIFNGNSLRNGHHRGRAALPALG